MGEVRSRIAETLDNLNRYLSSSDSEDFSVDDLRSYVAAEQKVRVRNRESGRLVWVLPETLQENPSDYLPESSPPPYKPELLKSNKYPKLKPIKHLQVPKRRNPYTPRRKHELKHPIPPKDMEDWKRVNLLKHFTKA